VFVGRSNSFTEGEGIMNRFTRWVVSAAAGAVLLVPSVVSAQVLTFEGLQNNEEILDFYNGGTGSLGSAGTNYGIQFTNGALALIDADDGGSGNYENNPSGSTIAYFLSSNSLVMNVAAGFSTGFSFFYSSSVVGAVTVWDGLNATGTMLAQIILAANWQDNCPAYGPGRTGGYCNWDAIGVAFGGTARSVDFAGGANFTGFDDITLNSSTPGVPEPASMILMASGLAAAAAARRRRAASKV
jgi:hypothetical protein